MPVAEIEARIAPSRIGLLCLALQPRAVANQVCGSDTLGTSVLPSHPVAIAAVHHRSPPELMGEIPLDGLSDAGLERFSGRKAQLALDLRGVDGIPAIVSRSIPDEADQLLTQTS